MWGYYDQGPMLEYSVDRAKALLAEAGYANGFDLTMEIVTGREMHQQVATLVKDMWAKIGVNLTIVPLESGLYNDNYYNNKFQVHINGWTDDIPDISQGVSYAMVYKTSESFHSGFQSDEVDKMAADALKLPNGPEREAMYKQLQQIFNDNLPFIPMYHEP
jgi:peptide/nickel transport system substrate-binding protein